MQVHGFHGLGGHLCCSPSFIFQPSKDSVVRIYYLIPLLSVVASSSVCRVCCFVFTSSHHLLLTLRVRAMKKCSRQQQHCYANHVLALKQNQCYLTPSSQFSSSIKAHGEGCSSVEVSISTHQHQNQNTTTTTTTTA